MVTVLEEGHPGQLEHPGEHGDRDGLHRFEGGPELPENLVHGSDLRVHRCHPVGEGSDRELQKPLSVPCYEGRHRLLDLRHIHRCPENDTPVTLDGGYLLHVGHHDTVPCRLQLRPDGPGDPGGGPFPRGIGDEYLSGHVSSWYRAVMVI